MAAAIDEVSQLEEEISMKRNYYFKLLWENKNKSSPESDLAFNDYFYAAWRKYSNRSTPGFDDEIGGVATDSQVETAVEKLESRTKDSYDLIGAVVLDSTAKTNCSHRLGELQMTDDEIVFNSKSVSLDSGDLSSDDGNSRSTPTIDLSSVDGFGTVDEIQKDKSTTMFLGYQEGKPFTSDNEFRNDDMGFEVRRVINGEVKDFNSLNEFSGNSSTPLETEEGNYISKLKSGSSNVVILFENADYVSKFSKMFSLPFIDTCYVNLNVHKVLFVVDNKLCSGKHFCCNFELARTLFDRGKWVELIRIYSQYNSSSFHFSFSVLKLGLLVLNGFILEHSLSANFISDPNSKLGCHLDLLIKYSNGFECEQNGYKHVVSKLFEEQPQRNNVLYTISRSYVTKEWVFGSAGDLSLHIHSNSRWSFKGTAGFLELQLRYCVRRILSGARYFHCSLYVTGKVFDRGRWLALVISSSELCSNILTYELLGEHEIELVFGNNSDIQVVCKFLEEMLQQGNLLWLFENTHELKGQIFGNCKKSFSGNKGYLKLQLGYGLLEMYESVMGSLSSGGCLFFSQDFDGRVIDRGKLLELIRRNTEFCLDTLAPCMFVFNELKLIFLIVINDGGIEACEFFDETVQKVHVLCTILRLCVQKGNRSGNAKGTSYQLLVGDNNHIQVKGALQGFNKMEILSPVSFMLLVWKLITLRKYNSSYFDFSGLTFKFWSMRNVGGYVLVS